MNLFAKIEYSFFIMHPFLDSTTYIVHVHPFKADYGYTSINLNILISKHAMNNPKTPTWSRNVALSGYFMYQVG